MAIFLLIYVFFVLACLAWGGMLTFLILKHRMPDNFGIVHLIIFWMVMLLIFVISIVFIAKADWVTVPKFFSDISY